MRICKICKAEKQDAEFAINTHRKAGVNNECKSCKNEYNKIWYERNKDKHKAQTRKNSKAHVQDLRNLVLKCKSVPCADCGCAYPYYVMDFDHLPGQDKSFGICAGVSIHKYTLEKLKTEIAKCEVVCSNCHRERTHKRLYASRSEISSDF